MTKEVKRLSLEQRLEFARAGVAVLRSLALEDRTMRYAMFARSIGLLPINDPWTAWYKSRVEETLQLISAVSDQAHSGIDCARIVGDSGEPGNGIFKQSSITRKAKDHCAGDPELDCFSGGKFGHWRCGTVQCAKEVRGWFDNGGVRLDKRDDK